MTPMQSERVLSKVKLPSSALQIHNRYLVTETDEGVMVIDQHALHERILYEQLRHRVSANAMETQNLLVPEPVDLSAAEAAAALENRDLLAELGMKIEPFGGDTVLVVGYPAMLANISPWNCCAICSIGCYPAASSPTAAICSTTCCTPSPARRRSRRATGSSRKRLPRCWSSVIWSKMPTTAPTAGPRR